MSKVIQFPRPVKTIPYEHALDVSATWLEGAHKILEARTAQGKDGRVTLSQKEADDLTKGLRIIVSNLQAMKASLE